MKTYKNLTPFALSDECMDKSLITASERKTERPEVIAVFEQKEKIKAKLREKILAGSLKPLIHKAHNINDGVKQKKRTIIQPYFTPTRPEQWIQHIVVHTLMPLFTTGMYELSCGSVPGRGVHYGKKKLEKFIKRNPDVKYVLKLDIKHFYKNVDVNLLKEKFAKYIKDDVFLKLVYFVLDSNVGVLPDGQVVKEGLPIGFYTSQWFANWFLQPLDHTIKEDLKALFYIRYMDDIVILGKNKRELRRMFYKIRSALAEIGLEVKSNWQIFLFDYTDKDGKRRGRPIDFMGFKFYRDKTTIRKSIFLRACRLARHLKKKLKITYYDACRLLSYMGWFYPTDTYMAYSKHIEPNVNVGACRKIVSIHDKKKQKQRSESLLKWRENGNNLQNRTEQQKAG